MMRSLWTYSAILLVVGCTSYQAQPLDLASFREDWQERSVEWERGEGQRLDLEIAESLAMKSHPDLRRAAIEVKAALANLDNSGLYPDPIFNAQAEKILESAENPWIAGGTLQFALPFSGRLSREQELAREIWETEWLRYKAARWRVRMEVRGAYFRLAAVLEESLEVQRFLELVARIEEVIPALESTGDLSLVEAGLLRLQIMAVKQDLRRLTYRVEEARQVLLQRLGLDPQTNFLFSNPESPILPKRPEAWRSRMAQSSPRLLLARGEYQVSEKSLRLEIARQIPDLQVALGFGREDDLPRGLFSWNWVLGLWNRNRLAVAQAQVTREKSRADFETLFQSLDSSLAQVRIRWSNERQNWRWLEDEWLPLVNDQTEAALGLAQMGEFEPLSLLQVLTRDLEARRSKVQAKLALALAMIDIQSLLGPDEYSESPPESDGEQG